MPPLPPLKCNQADSTVLLLPGQRKAPACKTQTSARRVRAGRKDMRNGEELREHVKGGTPGHLPRGHVGQDKPQLVKQVPELKAKRERLAETGRPWSPHQGHLKDNGLGVRSMRSPVASISQGHLSSRWCETVLDVNAPQRPQVNQRGLSGSSQQIYTLARSLPFSE